jgi:hypothetical protein
VNQFDLRVTREGDYVRTLRSLRELLFGVLDALDTINAAATTEQECLLHGVYVEDLCPACMAALEKGN